MAKIMASCAAFVWLSSLQKVKEKGFVQEPEPRSLYITVLTHAVCIASMPEMPCSITKFKARKVRYVCLFFSKMPPCEPVAELMLLEQTNSSAGNTQFTLATKNYTSMYISM